MTTFICVTELSGFATAVALVRPSKSIHDVDVKSVKKKMKDKAFAAKVNREDIIRGAEEPGMPLDDLIAEVITALQGAAPHVGIAGNRATASSKPANCPFPSSYKAATRTIIRLVRC